MTNNDAPPPALESNSASAIFSRRRHERYKFEKPGLLRIEGVRGGMFVVTVLDISKSGLRLNSPKSVEVGTRVEVHCLSKKILGRVRYVREVGGFDHHIGVEAEAVEAGGMVSPTGELDLTSLFEIARPEPGQALL